MSDYVLYIGSFSKKHAPARSALPIQLEPLTFSIAIEIKSRVIAINRNPNPMSVETTTKPWRRPSRRQTVIYSLVFSVFAFPTLAADDYLDALDAEVSDLEVSNAVDVNAAKGVEQDVDTFPDNLDITAFEQTLRTHFIGSFMFYSKLSDNDKTAVYDEYQSSKDIELIRKKIISLFSAK